jgi:hypothetical protein
MILGRDINTSNPILDWQAFKKKYQFVYLPVSTTSSDAGFFVSHRNSAFNQGVSWGAYTVLDYKGNTEEQASGLSNAIPAGNPGALIPAVKLIISDDTPRVNIIRWLGHFIEYFQALNKRSVMVYMNSSTIASLDDEVKRIVAENQDCMPEISQYWGIIRSCPLWLACWRTSSTALWSVWEQFAIWQYADGENRFMGTLAELNKWGSTGILPASSSTSTGSSTPDTGSTSGSTSSTSSSSSPPTAGPALTDAEKIQLVDLYVKLLKNCR